MWQRGNLIGDLTVRILQEGVHSGKASGIIPGCFRVVSQLLSRIENPVTGEIILTELHAPIPSDRIIQAKHAASVLKEKVWQDFPLPPHVKPVTEDLSELLLNQIWRPALSITGGEGLPTFVQADKVARPYLSLQLSMRIPAGCDPEKARKAIKEVLKTNPPYHAEVSYYPSEGGSVGWNAPELSSWLAQALDEASYTYFQKPAVYFGEGGDYSFYG